MAYEFRLQDPGEGIHEAEILEIAVSKGDHVNEGDDVLVAETDKAAVDIPAPVTGEVLKINVGKGDIVHVGDVLMVFEEDKDKAEDDEDGGEDAAKAESEPRSRKMKSKEPKEEEDDSEEDGAGDDEAVDRDGSNGQSQRVRTRSRAEKPTDRKESSKRRAAEEEADESASMNAVRAAPVVRGLARELDVDLDDVTGSGPEGRILQRDVRAASERAADREGDERKGKEKEKVDRRARAGRPDETRREPLRSVRRVTARRMAAAWHEIPHVVHHDQIDISSLDRLREERGEEADELGGKLTITPFLVRALSRALRHHPRFNASFDAEENEIEYKNAVNVGVAVDTERGLMVPVVRDADRKSVLDLAVELTALSEAVRNGWTDGELLKGGTFTLTNVGAIGGTGFSPIINPPQVAIFGAARAELKPVVAGDLELNRTKVALMLPVCIAFDHRVADGADAAHFMNSVKALLEDPAEFLLRG